MLGLAHASSYHWGLVGKPSNRAVSEWQISRIYAELGQPDLALRYAKSCEATCRSNGLSEIAHTADEAMARAYAVGKDFKNARLYLNRARERLDKLTLEKDDRSVYMKQISETEALVLRRP